MRKIRKYIGIVLMVVFLLSFAGIATRAATYVDTETPGTLTLTYGYDGQLFSGLEIRIYQVASISKYGDFALCGGFQGLPVEVNQIRTQGEWKQLASTLSAFVTAEGIPADRETLTGEDGTAAFRDLPLGLYLVESVRVELENGYCQFDSFLISVPNLDDQDAWVYDVIAKPKSVFQEFAYEEIEYTVNKLWKDEGHTHLRPQSITLELYRDGVLVETVVLSGENHWTYSWTTLDDGAVWQVVEVNVPDGYTVTMEQREAYFFVTNSYDEPVPPPDTGDISNTRVYLIVMIAAGLGLIVLGITGRREKKV